DPLKALEQTGGSPSPVIARGPDIFRPLRGNATGWDITDPLEVAALEQARGGFRRHHWTAGDPLKPSREVRNPADLDDLVGIVHEAEAGDIEAAFTAAQAAQPGWAELGVDARAAA